RRRIDRCGAPEALRVRPVDIGWLERVAGDGWVAVGDAASAFDPLSGSGVRKALVEAERAARAIRERLKGSSNALPEYAAAVAGSFEWQLRKRNQYYSLERRWPDSTFWSKRSRPA